MARTKLNDMAQVVMRLVGKCPSAKIEVLSSDGNYIGLDNREVRDVIRGVRIPSTVPSKSEFNEAYIYLRNAQDRLNSYTAEGYSDCKTNCRCALISVLKVLTGKENVKEAVKELGNQGVLGEREEEFTKKFNELLVIIFL